MCREVSIEFNKISTRFKVHKLSLNISKTYYIIFNLVNATYEENINMGNVDIDKVHCSNFLGVYIDCKLRWFDHVSSIRTKMAKNMSVMHGVKWLLNQPAFILYIVHLYFLTSHTVVKYGETHTKIGYNLCTFYKYILSQLS